MGLVIAQIPFGAAAEEVRSITRVAGQETPEGRILAVSYEMEPEWKVSRPVESEVVRSLLGKPSEREPNTDWLFFGNLEVRVCLDSTNYREVEREIGIVLLRRSGDMAYRRRDNASPNLVREATIPTLHPVFTRDVANNVWHLPVTSYDSRIRNRLAPLCAWPDEKVLVMNESSRRFYPVKPINHSSDLIGVPTKQDYEWVTGQSKLFSD